MNASAQAGRVIGVIAVGLFIASAVGAEAPPASNFATHCASCHGADLSLIHI